MSLSHEAFLVVDKIEIKIYIYTVKLGTDKYYKK